MIHRLLRTHDERTRTAAGDAAAKEQRRAERAARKGDRLAAKREADAQRQVRRQEAADRAQAARLAREASAANAFEHYLHVRSWARRMKDASEAESLALSRVEQHIVADLAPLWNAAPEVIAALRHHCEPISGVRVRDYDVSSSPLAKRIRRDLKRLYMEVGRESFVSEPALLGGFGYESDGQRYNDDTVKFFNVMVALQDGAVLGGIRSGTSRRLVWEIGGGWGGFAYQFKTLCPNTTYLVTGLPDLLLVSAVYLMTAFPSACCRFYSERSPQDVWQEWEEADFIFAPESAVATLGPVRLDLTLDVMSLRTMTAERAASHVQRAFECGSRYFYSLHPGGYSNQDLPGVWKAIERFFWLQPVAPRIELGKVPEVDYSHVIGWRRLRV